MTERTFGRLEVELVRRERYAARDEAKASLSEHVGVYHNRVRWNSTLEHMTPDEFERTRNPELR